MNVSKIWGSCSANELVTTNLTNANIIANEVPFVNDLYEYLNNVYNVLKSNMDSDIAFLKDIECRLSTILVFANILNGHLDKLDYFEKMSIDDIRVNDILIVKAPVLTAEYHYFTAVIGEEDVATFQSFGSSRRLYKVHMQLNKFKDYLSRMKTHGKNSLETDYARMVPVETELFELERMTRTPRELESESDDEDGYDSDEIAAAEAINVSPEVYDLLTTRHKEYNTFELNIYRLKPVKKGGTRRKRSKRKTKRRLMP
jgi:hypothetical protein